MATFVFVPSVVRGCANRFLLHCCLYHRLTEISVVSDSQFLRLPYLKNIFKRYKCTFSLGASVDLISKIDKCISLKKVKYIVKQACDKKKH